MRDPVRINCESRDLSSCVDSASAPKTDVFPHSASTDISEQLLIVSTHDSLTLAKRSPSVTERSDVSSQKPALSKSRRVLSRYSEPFNACRRTSNSPDAPDAQRAKQQIWIWQDKAGGANN